MTFTAHHFDPATQSYGPVEMGKGVTLSAKVDTNHRIMSDVWGCATHVTYWDEQAQHPQTAIVDVTEASGSLAANGW